MRDFVIRNPKDEDAEQIEGMDFVLKMLYLYHGDLDKRNMFCAVSRDGEVLAASHLMEHDTFHAVGHDEDPSFKRYLNYEIIFAENAEDEGIKAALIEALIGRAREIKTQYQEKRIILAQHLDTDDFEELSFCLARGFTICDTIVVYKFDLSREIPKYPLPEGVLVKPTVLDHNHGETQDKYHQAELASFDGVAWSFNHLGWMQGSPEIVNFCAFHGDQLIGNTSTWRITEERSATENVFVIPEWQKKGVARNIICTALAYLKEQGKTIATLGTYGNNKKAIRLYTQIGYELYGFRFTVGYEIV
ncbi:ribosomal-protein-alanine N-acetyltransferase [compost metagenome]